MNDTIITIEGAEIDLEPGTVVTQSLKAFSIGELATRHANFTNQLKAPVGTRNNDRIFENAGNVSSETLIPYRKKNCVISQGGIDTVNDGILSVDKVDKNYNIQIFSGTKQFFDVLGDKKLSDLTGYVLSADSVVAAAARNSTSGLVYPVGYYGTSNAPADIIQDLPSFYYHTIINEIIAQAGYTKTGAVFTDAKHLKKAIVLTDDKYKDSFIKSRTANVYVAVNQVFSPSGAGAGSKVEFTGIKSSGLNPLGYWNGTDSYIGDDATTPAANNTLFRVTYKWGISITVTGGTVDIGVSVPGLAPISFINVGSGSYNHEFQPGSFDVDRIGRPGSVYPSLSLYIKANSGSPSVTVLAGSMTIEPSGDIPSWNSVAEVVYFTGLLPDVTQKDFIKDFMIHHGLVFEEKLLNIEAKSFDDIIADRSNAKDWTNKRVNPKKQDIEFTPLDYAQRNLFSYQGESFGDGFFEIDNENIEPEKTIYTSLFNYTGMVYKGDIFMANIPVFDDAPMPPALALRDYQNSIGNTIVLLREPYSYEPSVTFVDGNVYSDYLVAYFDDPNQADTMDFQQDIDENYPLLIASLQRAKIVNREYKLTPLDIADFSFFFPIFDSGEYFLVNEIKNFINRVPNTSVEIFKV